MKDPIRVTTFTRIWLVIRRWLSRAEWAVWLLGLSREKQQPIEPGLILIQIDGLSQNQLQRALESGRMPFTRSLVERESYVQHRLYSGLPSSTPGVQGELYYGRKTIVPAFGFRDHKTGRLVRMFANDVAGRVEEQLKLESGESGLLSGGSSYCNIYAGGADDVYFCATSFGWSEFFKTVNPLQILLVLLLNVVMFARIAGLMFIEFVLATFDFVRGVCSGKEFWQELVMIPARVTVVVLLRELVTIGTCFDASRGQPIIHLNLLGYDEQAHRRGPSSRFAHWTLSGIDHAVKRIWRAAHLGAGREYDVWIFSDHGQEPTRPYQNEHEKPIQQVVAELAIDECGGDGVEPAQMPKRLPSRANWLGISWLVSMLFGEQDLDIQTRSSLVQTVTSGPIGFVYFLNEKLRAHRHEFAQRLVNEFSIPMTIVSNEQNNDNGRQTPKDVSVYTREGAYSLPKDVIPVFGANHPFLQDIAADTIELVQHPDAGDIVIVGWDATTDRSASFVLQHGAHAGPGVEETSAFALLPPDIRIGTAGKNHIRPDDLRIAALRLLGREQKATVATIPSSTKPSKQSLAETQHPDGRSISILTYNVHACVGMDGQLSPERIARVIAQSGADVVCLQELDMFRSRSGNRDQSHAIAKFLEMQYEFHPAWHLEEEQFGNAILTRFPMTTIRTRGLHHHKRDRSRRSAIWVELDIGGGVSLQVINTHLSIYPTEQQIQAQQLLEEWVQPALLLGPVVLCGDFNARPESRTCRALSSTLRDVESFDANPTRSTLFSPFPFSRVDHIFVSSRFAQAYAKVIDTRLASIASDHLPLLGTLRIRQTLSERKLQRNARVVQPENNV